MNLDFSLDQAAFHEALMRILDRYREQPREGGKISPSTYVYADGLIRDLSDNGFLDVARTEGFGAIEAALLIYETARVPLVIETLGSALIAPLLGADPLKGPVAVATFENLPRAVRFLDLATAVYVDDGKTVRLVDTSAIGVAPVHAMFAYPLGRATRMEALGDAPALSASQSAMFRRLWRVGLSAEIAGLLQGAIDFTTTYVKERRVFQRPVGSFQAVQHRLAMDVHAARGAYWLAMLAAASGTDADARTALTYAKAAIRQTLYDVHQFNGALGMTLEHPLHFWTFRLRLLEGELGGPAAQASALAVERWGA